MEIRRTPGTAVPRGQLQFADGGGPVDLSGIADAVKQTSDMFMARQQEREQFDLNKRLLRETNDLRAEYERRRRDPAYSAQGFAENFDAFVQERQQQVVSEYEELGYDRGMLNQFSTGYERLRVGLYGDGLGYEMGVYAERAVTESEELLNEGTRTVEGDPGSYSETRDYVIETLRENPDLTEDQIERQIREVEPRLRVVAGLSLVKQDPDYVIDMLDPEGRYGEHRAVASRPSVLNVEAPELDEDGIPTQLTQEQYQVTVNAMGQERTDAFIEQHGIEVLQDFSPGEIVVEGDPALGALTGEERLRVLGLAYQEIESRSAADRAGMDITLNNIEAEAFSPEGIVTAIPSNEDLLRVYGPDRGPQIIARVASLRQVSERIRGWTLSPNSTIETELEALRPRAGDPAFAVKREIYGAAEQAAQAILAQRREDPAAYVIANVDSVREAIDSGNSTAYYARQRRMQEQLGIPEGQRNLWPQEYIDAEKQRYDTLSPSQRLSWILQHFRGLTRAEASNFVQGLEGSEAYDEALVAQLMEDRGDFNQVMPLVLEGWQRIRDDPARRPSPEMLGLEFADSMFDGIQQLNPDASRSIQNAAAAIYVSRGGDPSNADSSLYSESLRMAVGGRVGDSNTGWADFSKNGVSDLTILPAGATRQQFENWLETRTDADIARMSLNGPPVYTDGTPVPVEDIIEEGVLVMSAPNTYTVKFGPTSGIYGEDGFAIQLRLNPREVLSQSDSGRTTPSHFGRPAYLIGGD